jgi:hypothetical protein
MMIYLNPESLERVNPKLGDILIEISTGKIGGKPYVTSRFIKVINYYVQAGDVSISTTPI